MPSSNIPFITSGSYPVRAGNSVRPWIDGEPAFRRICEAIEVAQLSVWVTVTFLWEAFEMPDRRGNTFDVLDRAARRGVDVRVIFWRPDAETKSLQKNAFWGSAEHIALLESRRSGIKARWDRAHPGFCQHQKTWLIDAETEMAIAFVGGINLNPHSMCMPGHSGEGQNHDVYMELAGPSVVDVHHNFVQRWNEASERSEKNGHWGSGSETNLSQPVHIPVERGNATVQIQRTIHAGRYRDGEMTQGGRLHDIASGERTNFDQYCAAIRAARSSIYIENQYLDVPEIVDCLHMALQHGVHVILLMPAKPQIHLPISSERRAFLASRSALGRFEHFMLAGIAGLGSDGQRHPVYVHAKLMLIDDTWATVGSCNLHGFSLFGNTEMNVAFSEPSKVRSLRSELFHEHLGQDTSGMSDREAFRLFRKIARTNRRKSDAGDPDWQGIAFELDPQTYVG